MPFHSVRFRLTLWYGGVLAVVLTVFALGVWVFVVQSLQSNIDEALQSYGDRVGHQAASHLHGKRLDVRSVSIDQNEPDRTVSAILIMNVRGETKRLVRGHAAVSVKQLRFAIRSGHQDCETIAATKGSPAPLSPFRVCTRLQYSHGKPVAGVEVVSSLAGAEQALDRLRLALLLGVPFALVLAGGGGWLLAGRALEPVERITQMARSITVTDLSRRINLRRQDELGRLAGTFDEMIGRLERSFREQRQLTADVSHELRSPLTVLEAQTSLALRRPRTREEYRQILGSVQVVDQLLTLARAEAGEEPVSLAPLALGEIVGPAVESMQPLAEERCIELRLLCSGNTSMAGDTSRLRRLTINLLDNALEHTPAGGHVEVRLEREAGQIILEVTDTGVGIDAVDLPNIFTRFYRGDRSRGRGSGHSGLGLAIVRWIVEAHGGTIEAASAPGQGARFTVRFPAEAAVLTPIEIA
jgi:heavy metal sensor kinase